MRKWNGLTVVKTPKCSPKPEVKMWRCHFSSRQALRDSSHRVLSPGERLQINTRQDTKFPFFQVQLCYKMRISNLLFPPPPPSKLWDMIIWQRARVMQCVDFWMCDITVWVQYYKDTDKAYLCAVVIICLSLFWACARCIDIQDGIQFRQCSFKKHNNT